MPKKLALPEAFTDKMLKSLSKELGCSEPLTTEFLRTALENAILFDHKQKDYGPRNISDFGTVGCVIRMNDKVSRLKELLGNKRRKARNESIEDSFRDCSNYSIIALLVEKGVWPK